MCRIVARTRRKVDARVIFVFPVMIRRRSISTPIICLSMLCGLVVLVGFNTSSKATRDSNLTMGNPSGAAKDTECSDDYLIIHDQYALSYNSSKGIPNWVSWHLSSAWKGDYKRTNPFRSDRSIPKQWYRVTKKDYNGSGFDRGHMCPSDDRDYNRTDNDATFFMTNMVPQAHQCNDQPWGDLEDYARELAAEGNELYIVAGPLGNGGVGAIGPAVNISKGRVEVPAYVWKVLLILENGKHDVARVGTQTRTIAVMMPNTVTAHKHKWSYYRTSVDEIECLTGYDFFSVLDDEVEASIEARVDSMRFLSHHL